MNTPATRLHAFSAAQVMHSCKHGANRPFWGWAAVPLCCWLTDPCCSCGSCKCACTPPLQLGMARIFQVHTLPNAEDSPARSDTPPPPPHPQLPVAPTTTTLSPSRADTPSPPPPTHINLTFIYTSSPLPPHICRLKAVRRRVRKRIMLMAAVALGAGFSRHAYDAARDATHTYSPPVYRRFGCNPRARNEEKQHLGM